MKRPKQKKTHNDDKKKGLKAFMEINNTTQFFFFMEQYVCIFTNSLVNKKTLLFNILISKTVPETYRAQTLKI